MILRAVVVPHLVYAEPHFVLKEGEQLGLRYLPGLPLVLRQAIERGD